MKHVIDLVAGPLALLLLSAAALSAAPAQPLRIALVADPHITRGTAEDQAQYKGRFDRVIASVNDAKVDLVLIAGDLTQGGKPEDIGDFQAQIKGFQTPVWVAPGNHDVGDKHMPGKKGGVTTARVNAYEAAYGPSFWSRNFQGIRVIGVNSSLLGSGLPAEADQWAFLEKELDPANTMPTLLVMHYPLFLHTPDEPGGGYWNVEPEPRARLLGLIMRSKSVRAVLTGHLHRSIAAQIGDVFFYTTPPVSFGIPRGRQPEGWTLITLSPDGSFISADFHPTDAPAEKLTKSE
jgi:3',5'-cyclic AMP phosphodiesterase CpdA